MKTEEIKMSRIFATVPEATRDLFIATARIRKTNATKVLQAFVNQYVAGESTYTDKPALQEGEVDNPLAGLSTGDAQLVRRLIAAIRSGAFEDSQTIDRLLRAFEATRSHEEEAPTKGKKHHRTA